MRASRSAWSRCMRAPAASAMRSDEGGGLRLPADHLVLGGVGGPGRVAEQPGQLGAPGEHPREHLEVGRVGALPLQAPEPLAQRGALGPGHHRDVVGGVGGDGHQAVLARAGGRAASPRAARPARPGRPAAASRRRGRCGRTPARCGPARRAARAPAPGWRSSRSTPARRKSRSALLDQEAGDGVGAREVDPGQRLVQPAVEREPGLEGVDLLLVPLGRVAHLGRGVDVAEQARLGRGVSELGEGVVEEAAAPRRGGATAVARSRSTFSPAARMASASGRQLRSPPWSPGS